jgi:DNA-binding NtrC family response regulator
MTDDSGRERILIVDDAADTIEIVQRNLKTEGYQVFSAGSVADALKVLASNSVDLVITDMKMPRVSGMDLVRHISENLPDTEVMMITGYATLNGAVEAVKTGAQEYLAKPFTDQELSRAVRRTLDRLSVRRKLHPHLRATTVIAHDMVAESQAMQKVLSAIDKAAGSNATVLIIGESGTGKELVARAIHYNSSRAAGAFVPVNCGGIPESLLESELFGHVKGAFTGATASRAGFFQTAEGGTVFLDEIGETCNAMQIKLLRVLQEGEVSMVGADLARKVDVRILAATNKDLGQLKEKGLFRDDLFYRLNVISIELPPLRRRGQDVLVLARHFAERFAREQEKPVPEFSDQALQVLSEYYWPGNVRELQNVVQRLVVMTEQKTIDVSDLPELMRFSALSEGGQLRTLAAVEAEHIKNILAAAGGNKTKAAQILGIDRKTLREKLKNSNI